jgi:hypothetical protein
MIKKLWYDDSGAVISAELVLVVSIIGIGLITGLDAVRQSILAESLDVAQAIMNINQSYGIASVRSPTSWTAGSSFNNMQGRSVNNLVLGPLPDFANQNNNAEFSSANCVVVVQQ